MSFFHFLDFFSSFFPFCKVSYLSQKTTPPPKEWKLIDWIPHAVEYLRFSANEDAIEIPLKKPELKFDCLIMPNSKLVNRHVLSSFTGWGIPVHTVNLDNTKVHLTSFP